MTWVQCDCSGERAAGPVAVLGRSNQPSERVGAMERDGINRPVARHAVPLIGALLLLAAAAGPNELAGTDPEAAGFWLGLWHGLISPVTFVVSLCSTQT
jgi:hypothetical protein